jgi:hypothetical protein
MLGRRCCILVSSIHLALFASAAQAASLERLGDGRIVLKALGEELAFREKDAPRIGLYWPSYPCDPKRSGGVTLALWLEDPKVAECLKTAIPDNFVPGSKHSLTLKIYLGYEDGSRYPGAGKRIDRPLGQVSPLYPGRIEQGELPEPPFLSGELYVGLRHPFTELECLTPIQGQPDALGYRSHGGDKSPPNEQYSLPANRRMGAATRPLCLGCSHVSSAHCAVALRSADKVVALSLEWFDWDFHGPRPTWVMYDAAARKIAQSIFIDRTPGDLQ